MLESISYQNNTRVTPATIRKHNLALLIGAGTLAGISRVDNYKVDKDSKNIQRVLSPLDDSLFGFIKQSKNKNIQNFGKSLEKFFTMPKSKYLGSGKFRFNPKLMAAGAGILAGLYLIPKIALKIIESIKE